MSDIKRWSNLAASNNSAAPDGAPEGTFRFSEINDTLREFMAAIRRQHENAQWIDYGHSLSFMGSLTFKAIGSDLTSIYQTGRRILAYDGGGTMYGDIVSSSFVAGDTVVIVNPDSGGMDSSLSAVAVGMLTPTNSSLPKGGDLYAGARLSASALAAENATISYLVAHGGSLSGVTIVNPTITGATLVGSASSLLVGSLGATDASFGALRAASGSLSNMVLIAPTITTGSASQMGIASLSAGTVKISGGVASLNTLSVASLYAIGGTLSSMVIENSTIRSSTLSGVTIASGSASALAVASLSAAVAQIGTGSASAFTVAGRAITGGFQASYDSGDLSITTAGTFALTHALGGAPTLTMAYLHCLTATAGYSSGDFVITTPHQQTTSDSFRGLSIVISSTTITVRFGSSAPFLLLSQVDGTQFAVDHTKWNFVVRAFR